jgi:biopolymer transport protein ExbD
MKIRLRRREDSPPPASAMSDIAFLLIVFFMVIAVFSVKEGFVIQTPKKEKTLKKASDQILKIQVLKEEYLVSGKTVEKEKLPEAIRREKQGKPFVVLEIEGQSRYSRVVDVLDIFARLKILDFSMKKMERKT